MNTEIILTVELCPSTHGKADEEIYIYCNKTGLELLIEKLKILNEKGGHVHFMTPSWAGNELTEDKQGENTIIINHFCVVLKSEQAEDDMGVDK